MGVGQSVLSSPDALTGLAGGLLTKEAYDRLSNIGEQAKREAMGIAERGQAESEFRPFTVTTPTQAMFSARPTEEGLQIGMELSPEEQALQQQLLGGAGGFFGQAMTPTQARAFLSPCLIVYVPHNALKKSVNVLHWKKD